MLVTFSRHCLRFTSLCLYFVDLSWQYKHSHNRRLSVIFKLSANSTKHYKTKPVVKQAISYSHLPCVHAFSEELLPPRKASEQYERAGAFVVFIQCVIKYEAVHKGEWRSWFCCKKGNNSCHTNPLWAVYWKINNMKTGHVRLKNSRMPIGCYSFMTTALEQ